MAKRLDNYRTWVGFVVIASCAGAPAWPIFETLRRSSLPTGRNLTNVKALTVAMHMYSTDQNDTYPQSADEHQIRAALWPYVKTDIRFTSLNPVDSHYDFYAPLRGRNYSATATLESIPMFFDRAMWPNRRRCVAFTDGHAAQLGESDFTWLRFFAAKDLNFPSK